MEGFTEIHFLMIYRLCSSKIIWKVTWEVGGKNIRFGLHSLTIYVRTANIWFLLKIVILGYVLNLIFFTLI